MKALILAGGFGTRLLGNMMFPKPLLEVAGKSILSYIIENLHRAGLTDNIIVSINEAFKDKFETYPVELISEKEKLGSVGAIQFVIDELNINDDLMIIAGDNLFDSELSRFPTDCITVGIFDLRDKVKASRYGVVEIEDGVIKDFEEKPSSPKSTLISTGIYCFPKESLWRFKEYISGNTLKDNMGNFLAWLCKRETLKAHEINGYWFDIGSHEGLREALKFNISYISSFDEHNGCE